MSSTGSSLPSRGAENGQMPLGRAEEVDELVSVVKSLVVPFIHAADEDALAKSSGHGNQQPGGGPRAVILEHHAPHKLAQLLDLSLPSANGRGTEGFVETVKRVLQYSVNTWDQGFLDKLYASITPVGLASDFLLSALNTNVHVYQVSPALTVIEKQTCRALAELFGFTGTFAGGVSQPGGSAANLTSLVVARNVLFPETKSDGLGGRRFVIFTSSHGHYSVEKAAQMMGFGSKAVRSVEVDEQSGCMRPAALEAAVVKAKQAGETPFYVNATAGTTVLGSFDPIDDVADICKRHGMWLAVDASWGGSVVFSDRQRHKLRGIEKADSISWCAHKMLNVPLTCSFLLGKDLRQFQKAMTLPAGYLFHDDGAAAPDSASPGADESREAWDLADLTGQCGRRGDSLKLAMSWIYYGTAGLGAYVDHAFEVAGHLATLVTSSDRFSLVSTNPPPCLQVCFYYDKHTGDEAREHNSRITEAIVKALVPRGFMVDYAPGNDGKFFRVVVNGQTRKDTVEGLLKAIEEAGSRKVSQP